MGVWCCQPLFGRELEEIPVWSHRILPLLKPISASAVKNKGPAALPIKVIFWEFQDAGSPGQNLGRNYRKTREELAKKQEDKEAGKSALLSTVEEPSFCSIACKEFNLI